MLVPEAMVALAVLGFDDGDGGAEDAEDNVGLELALATASADMGPLYGIY